MATVPSLPHYSGLSATLFPFSAFLIDTLIATSSCWLSPVSSFHLLDSLLSVSLIIPPPFLSHSRLLSPLFSSSIAHLGLVLSLILSLSFPTFVVYQFYLLWLSFHNYCHMSLSLSLNAQLNVPFNQWKSCPVTPHPALKFPFYLSIFVPVFFPYPPLAHPFLQSICA